MNNTTAQSYKILPYLVIVSAASNDPQAVDAVLAHYENYITALSLRVFCGESSRIDEALRRRLRAKLVSTVMKFKVA